MKKILFKSIILLAVSSAVSPAFANARHEAHQQLSDQVAQIKRASNEVYEDKIDISYLSKLVITPKDDWVGIKVFKSGNVCIEVTKELKFKKVDKPFEHLYRSANLPKSIDIGVMREDAKVVDCSSYVSKSKIIE